MSDMRAVNRDAFLRDLRRYCRKTGRSFEWIAVRGKGGHGIVTVDGLSTVAQTTLHIETILKQLGLPKDAV
jgi:hypothetical protein